MHRDAGAVLVEAHNQWKNQRPALSGLNHHGPENRNPAKPSTTNELIAA